MNSKWQPLNTAPQDHTEILIRYPLCGNVIKLVRYNIFKRYWESKGEPCLGLENQSVL
jgi:hypothetical protein